MIQEQILDIVTLKLFGPLGSVAVEELKGKMKDLIESGVRKVIIDLQEVDLVTSSGLGLLFTAQKELVRREGKLVLFSPRPLVRQTILDWHLDRLMGLHDVWEEAYADLHSIGETGPNGFS